MITNASSRTLTQNSGILPNLSETIMGWFQTLTFTKIVKSTANFDLAETPTSYTFQGVFQPFTAQQLQIKPEGQRQWKWFMIHSAIDLLLNPDEEIVFSGTTYRVMEKLDYKEYGYVEYHVVDRYGP